MANSEITYLGKTLLIVNNEIGKKIVVIGDLHLGYEESLNRSGVFIGRKMFDELLSDLENVFRKTGKVDEIILLGDVKHNFSENLRQEWNDVLELIDYLGKKTSKIVIIRGNHDNYLKTIVGKMKNVSVSDYSLFSDCAFLHGDRDVEEIWENNEIKRVIVGHGHPAIRISDGTKTEKYKCFLVGRYKGKEMIIVPSFAEFYKGTDVRERSLGLVWELDYNKFEVLVVDKENLKGLDFGKLGKIEN